VQFDHRTDGRPGHPAEAQFTTLFRRHYAELCTRAFRLTRDPALAEELVQDVFLSVWRRRGELLAPAGTSRDLTAYLRVAVRNRALHALARRRTHRHYEETAFEADVVMPEGDPNRAELLAAVDRALAELPERQRVAFMLHRFEGLSYRDIAARLAISVKTVETHMGRALRRLHERLEAHRATVR
jgi:RNA polymerase sigma-70 factor (ECF subfamily)